MRSTGRAASATLFLAAACTLAHPAPQEAAAPAKPDAAIAKAAATPLDVAAEHSVDAGAGEYVATSRSIFDHPETALKETRSSKLLADFAERAGFKLERGVAQMETAWVATWSSGSGGPTIGILAEFDALPSLSQVACATTPQPIVAGAPGHGCGHSLFGVASLAAAIAMKDALTAAGKPATIRLYGTPAEEQGVGKVFMVRDGLFDGVDAVLAWHPADKNEVDLQPSKACISFEVTFYGRSAHASAAPWNGVSALDAVEAFEHGVNLLREHVPETARMHYVVSNGGGAPNVVPNKAAVWMFVRGKDWPEAEKVFAHVKQMITGADMIAWGEEYQDPKAGYRAPDLTMLAGQYDMNINVAGSRILQAELERIGPAAYDASEQEYARALQASFGMAPDGYATDIVPFDPKRAPEPGGSTDVANVSWTVPTVQLHVATWPKKIPAHSWASTSASGAGGGFKAMLIAAKVMACAGLDYATDPAALTAMKEEFQRSRASFHYSPAVGPDDRPQLPSCMRAPASSSTGE